MTEVSFEITRTRADTFNAILTVLLRSPSTWAWYVGGALVVAVVAVAMSQDETVWAQLIVAGLVFLAMMTVFMLTALGSVYLAARKSWSAPGGLAAIKFQLSPAGLSAATATAQGVSGWDNWKAAFETNSLIIIRHHLGLVQIIPKRALPAELVGRIRRVLRENLKGSVRMVDEAGS